MADVTPEEVPTPLALAIEEFERETQPFRKVHRLIDAIEVLLKLHTVAIVSDWEQRLGLNEKIKVLIAAGLRTPSLGIWWRFAREIATFLRGESGAQSGSGLPEAVLGHVLDGPMAKHFCGADNFIALRNRYAHGATPPDEVCTEDLAAFADRFRALVAGAHHLRSIVLVAFDHAGEALAARGRELERIETPSVLASVAREPDEDGYGRCYLVLENKVAIDLYPLLVFQPGATGGATAGDGASGRFFFYNDLRKAKATILNYDRCRHQRSGAIREALLGRFPLHEWREASPEAEDFRVTIESLTEQFKGRAAELAELVSFLGCERGLLVYWGAPGIGKSALMARAVQVLGWPREARETAYPALPDVAVDLTVLPYFIRRDMGTNDAVLMLDCLCRRLDARWRLGLGRGSNARELAQGLRNRLKGISERLKSHQRLVLIFDGLDEGAGSEGMLHYLPKHAYPRILIVYASRPHAAVREGVWQALDRDHRRQLTLGGLLQEDVRALLYEVADKYRLDPAFVAAVAERSSGNPLFVKLLCEGLAGGTYRLNDVSRLPQKMDEIYGDMVERFGKMPLAVELLVLLAAARDYLAPSAMASMLGVPLDQVRRALPCLLEVLEEDPMTTGVDDYQLFHESLRDYLRRAHAHEAAQAADRIADWALGWRALAAHLRPYAMRHGVPHLVEARQRIQAAAGIAGEERERAAAGRLSQIVSLLDDREWREASFAACGNARALERSLAAVLPLLLESGAGSGTQLERIVRYGRLMHEEGTRIYSERLARIDGCRVSARDREDLVRLAAMGESARDRVLLLLRNLQHTGRDGVIPSALASSAKPWLEEAADPALTALWRQLVPARKTGPAESPSNRPHPPEDRPAPSPSRFQT